MRDQTNPRSRLVLAVELIIARAEANRSTLMLRTETERLLSGNPDSGWSEREVSDYLAEAAVAHRISVAFG